MKRILVILFGVFLGISWLPAQEEESIRLVEQFSQQASDMVRDRISGSSPKIFIDGIKRNGRSTPLGELFVLKASIEVTSLPSPRVTVVLDDDNADYALQGDVHIVGDTAVFGFKLIRLAEGSLVGGFDSTVALTSGMKRQLAAGGSGEGDEFEPNNSPEDAYAVELGQEISGLSLLPAGESDWFVIEATEDLEMPYGMMVETTGSIDTYAEVYGPGQITVIAENDDGDNGSNAKVMVPISEGGMYWVKIRGYDTSVTGTYGIRFSSVPANPDEFEPNGTQNQAVEIRLDERLRPSLDPAGDVDWYKVSIPAAEGARMLTVQTYGSLDTQISLFDEYGSTIASDDDSGDGENAFVGSIVEGGLFYIKVEGYEGAVQGDYSIIASVDTFEEDEYENNDTMQAAKEIVSGQEPQFHNFATGSDEDWLFFTISEQSRVIVETHGSTDTLLTLYNARESVLAESDDDGYDSNAKITATLAPGKYYVLASQYSDLQGAEYEISLSVARDREGRRKK